MADDRHPNRHLRAHGASAATASTFGTSEESGAVVRIAAAISSAVGTAAFVISAVLFIALWIGANALLGRHGWDPRPFILLNLLFSAEAFFTGSLVIIAAKQSARRDSIHAQAVASHMQEEMDALHHILEQQNEVLAEQTLILNALAAREKEHDA